MARKRKQQDEDKEQQLSLFDILPTAPISEPSHDDDSELDDNGDDSDYDDVELSFDPSDRTIEPKAPELLTLKLLRKAILAQNPDDAVMEDFAEYVLPNLLRVAIAVTAKGGKFFDKLDAQRLAAGKPKPRRDNAADQSLNSHLLNGIFPANLIEQRLEKLDTTVRRCVRERERRLLIAGFILHDFEKFNYDILPQMPQKYRDISNSQNQKIRDLSVAEHREIVQVIADELHLGQLIDPENPEAYQEYLDDLLVLAYNAQVREDTNWNFSVAHGLQPVLDDRTLRCLAALTCLADSFASIIKHPQDAEHRRFQELLHSLSDGQLKLSYHGLTENRGVLTNAVNNSLIEAHTALNTKNCTYYEPLLYLPTGVIYLAHRNAPPVRLEDCPEKVVSQIKKLCAGQLRDRQTGFGRDGKGMKYAEYYNLFFDDVELMQVALNATMRILPKGKSSVAQDRSDNLIKFQKQGVLPADWDFQFANDIRIDQLAEFGDLVSRKIWGDRVSKIENFRKQDKKNKNLPPVPPLQIIEEVAKLWQLSDYLPQIREIQRLNERLKENKLKGNTGGIPYEWYYLAAKYLERHPGVEEVREICQQAIAHIAQLIRPITAQYQLPDGWEDLCLWVQRVIILPSQPESNASLAVFADEFQRYMMAKKSGRGRQLICSISHSAYTVTEQMESAVLFTPQVYTNKQMLGGSNAKRNISSIAGIEMMLRQILMNQTQAVGKNFEDGKYRYLYFYPTYYFTPETNKFLHQAYTDIAQTRFTPTLRNHFISSDLQADFTKTRYQTVDSFLLDEAIKPEKDRTFKLSYPEDLPVTFYFMALPTPKKSKDHKPTDTESWIMPAWLAFAFPIIIDVKTAVSESPIPPFTDGAEFEESVFLDSPPPAFRVLTQRDRFRIDYILEGWQENGKEYPSPLNVLTAAYAIHLDVNARQGKKGYDANWGKFAELATDFETSPLSVFTYLSKWGRRQEAETASIKKIKLYAYQFYPCFDPYVQFKPESEELIVDEKSPLHHPKRLTELYRQFYRANKLYNPKANAVLKPIDIAADVILKVDPCFSGEALPDMVAAEICKLMDRVHSSTAEGRWVFKRDEREQEREKIAEFAAYFVHEVFENSFGGDRARLAGRQLNYLRDTCEYLYRLENDKEIRAKKEQSPDNAEDNFDNEEETEDETP
ncbi:type I-D CRISPR-associated protein Cas10d/Csc3 [[Phormidium] sp. ETS-05]|uniref:type I-D CRISPR-associated protein Cas10d/Csc3 n=1 Tax=[Phormidium] sp. ETS-05 TaxID=222819 RepID=UPI0018EEE372|nr:type I-D CRISPR-associated protein Cas10d/Csc3 [[Phormidium] sp. ETS-05]